MLLNFQDIKAIPKKKKILKRNQKPVWEKGQSWKPTQRGSVVCASYTRVITDHGYKQRNVSIWKCGSLFGSDKDSAPRMWIICATNNSSFLWHWAGGIPGRRERHSLPCLTRLGHLSCVRRPNCKFIVWKKVHETKNQSITSGPILFSTYSPLHLHKQPVKIRGPCSTYIPPSSSSIRLLSSFLCKM